MTFKELIDAIERLVIVGTPFALGWLVHRQGKMNKKQDAIHKDVNGKIQQLLKVSAAKEHAAGKVEGKQEQRAEGAETAAAVVQAVKDDPPSCENSRAERGFDYEES